MAETRRLTPSDIRAISNQVKADYQAAVAEARAIGRELDQYSELKAQSKQAKELGEGARTPAK
jgi:hypothetical protein